MSWGVHRCDLPLGHAHPHRCTVGIADCSEAHEDGSTRFWVHGRWSPWSPPGSWALYPEETP